MKNIVFFDGKEREQLLPLTYLRPSAHIMIGKMTIEAQWKNFFGCSTSYLTPSYLSALYPCKTTSDDITFVNGACLPSAQLVEAVSALEPQSKLITKEGQLVAFKSKGDLALRENVYAHVAEYNSILAEATFINYPEDILVYGTDYFIAQYTDEVSTKMSSNLDESNRVIGKDLFVGKDTDVTCAIINTTEGPVYIDDHVTIMEGAVIKGPVYLGPHSRIHVGTQVYPGTLLGPHCRIGGEIKRSTLFGYANKAHGGYLGDSVLGRWCNLGAATNNSNMKNTYGKVGLWDIQHQEKRTTELQFLGSILGDHTMTAIQTSLNTGTVTGVFACLLDRQPPTYVKSFSWGTDKVYLPEKAVEVARHAMSRRGITMSSAYADALHHIANER